MAPVALHPHDDGLTRYANSKNSSAVAVAVTAEPRDKPKTSPPVHLSSADAIRLEHQFGAHK